MFYLVLEDSINRKQGIMMQEYLQKFTTYYLPIDPPGHGRLGGHYFHTWCPSVRHKNTKTRYNARVNTMRENNENLLAGAWWVILNSPDLLLLIFLIVQMSSKWKAKIFSAITYH